LHEFGKITLITAKINQLIFCNYCENYIVFVNFIIGNANFFKIAC
jgi:hypothetical protein